MSKAWQVQVKHGTVPSSLPAVLTELSESGSSDKAIPPKITVNSETGK